MNESAKMSAACTQGAYDARAEDMTHQQLDWALGPGSVTWKVLKDPAVFFIGMLRTSMVIPLHPPFAAAAELDSNYLVAPIKRFRNIAVFAYSATYGTQSDAIKVASYVQKSHSRIKGIEPITELPFQAHSEYELALTSAVQTLGFITAYEELYGELPSAKRDQFIEEQKILGAILGVNPDHVPSTYAELMNYLGGARKHWAAGLVSRTINAPFVDSDFPEGSFIAELPWYKRKPIMWALRAVADMAIMLMLSEERLLLGINRAPKLRSRFGVRASYRLLSKFMMSKKGQALFMGLVGEKVSGIYRRALEIENSPGAAKREAEFKVPDPYSCFCDLPDLVKNWPGSPAEYRLGGKGPEEAVKKPLRAVNAS